MSNISASAFSDTKAHYDLLDGLRGVAALMVSMLYICIGRNLLLKIRERLWCII